MSRTVVIVEDDPTLRLGLRRVLESRGGFLVHEFGRAEEALASLDEIPTDVILTDLQMPGMGGLAFIEELSSRFPELPVVVVSGVPDLEVAARAVEAGATDFLQKPIGAQRVLVTVQNVLRLEALRRRTSLLERETRGGGTLIGDSPVMQRLRVLIDKVAPTEGRVLILGENGTGKELVANAIHRGSSRADGPMVKLNCAAVPSELVESELFGHEKGAFTGAARARRGRFEEASGGTLFLDEVGDMPLAMQAKLLRVLQEGRLERVGATRTLDVDVRVIAATNRNPREMVEAGTFREDLYYRLNVVTLTVPPLRERLQDVPLLARGFAAQIAARMGRRPLEIDEEALKALSAQSYPGNVRELMNLMERLTILADGERIGADDVAALAEGGVATADLYRPGVGHRELMQGVEKQIFAAAIAHHGGSKRDAAADLKIDRSHFYKKCKQLGVD